MHRRHHHRALRSAAQGRTIMPLTSDEARAVFPLAWSLPPDRTAEFVREVDAALAGHPARGEGLAHRVAVELMPRYFVPPPMLKKELEHVNIRKPWLRRRA
jgi:hypothetical protein